MLNPAAGMIDGGVAVTNPAKRRLSLKRRKSGLDGLEWIGRLPDCRAG